MEYNEEAALSSQHMNGSAEIFDQLHLKQTDIQARYADVQWMEGQNKLNHNIKLRNVLQCLDYFAKFL